MIEFDYSKHEEPDWHDFYREALGALLTDPASRSGAANVAAGIADWAMYQQRLRFSEIPRPTAVERPDPAPVLPDVPLDEPPLSERPPAPDAAGEVDPCGLDPDLVRELAYVPDVEIERTTAQACDPEAG